MEFAVYALGYTGPIGLRTMQANGQPTVAVL